MRVLIQDTVNTRLSQYACRELQDLLQRFTNCVIVQGENADRIFQLATYPLEPEVQSPGYRIFGELVNGTPVVTLAGSDDSALLCSVYEALSRMGLLFTMNGVEIHNAPDLTACDQCRDEITPFSRNRGIRQHINFPMDISSYHLEDAKEYIRNLARMQMNSITFHSYTGQWHGYVSSKERVYAGNFFYGQRHDVPEYEPVSSRVSNDRFYCIPEIEQNLFDAEKRGAFAEGWLRSVIGTAKEAGMNVTLSIELPPEEPIEVHMQIAKEVIRVYPDIDILEWITPEGGGSGKAYPLSDLPNRVEAMFGIKAKEAVSLCLPETMPESFPGAAESLNRAVALYHRKGEILSGRPDKQIAIGLYVMCRETLRLLKQIMAACLPPDVLWTFLPAHGSLAVAENIAYMDFTPEELQRTMMYSWLEFDGNMYLQQNSSQGIAVLLRELHAKSKGETIHGVCFNHWRTAENEPVAAFMAKAALAPVETSGFYPGYALRYGIGEPDRFSDALLKLEEIDTFNRDNLFNIGFCYLGCWLMYPGLGWIRGWKPENMEKSMEMYHQASALLTQSLCCTNSVPGIGMLRLLLNRIQCSVLQIRSVLELSRLCEFTDDSKPHVLTKAQKTVAAEACKSARNYALRYLDCHMQLLPDRGCEGTAVSYAATIPVYIDHIQQYFIDGEETCIHQPDTFDKPPAPDTAYL